jgi:hypothetical protein
MSYIFHASTLCRRIFLKRLGIASLGLVAVDKLLADPYGFALPEASSGMTPVKIRGSVKVGGRGLKGAAVSDGATVVTTKADGSFELVSIGRAFVFVSIPSGFEIPTNPTGTALFYKPIVHNSATMNVQWNLVKSNSSDTEHGFLLLADPQTLDAEDMNRLHTETVPDIQHTLKGLGSLPMFTVGCGDIMFNRLDLFPEYEKAVKLTGVPGFQVIGNHDLELLTKTDEQAAATFMRYFGPTYYSFNRGDVHYVVLDDVFWYGAGYIGYIEQTQLDWLKADLSLIEKGRTVVVFTHIPPYNEQHVRFGLKTPSNSETMTNRESLFRLLEPFASHIIVGHMHESEHLVEQGSRIHVGGAVCGAWWTGDICFDGTPNGYPVYEVKGSELRWRYKGTGQPFENQIRIYPRGSDPKRPDEIIANVWDANAQWNIAWYEDGERKGMMTRGLGLDPMSVKLHAGEQLPLKHTWVDPANTDHLFYAKPSGTTKEILVEATDQWGRVYKAKA